MDETVTAQELWDRWCAMGSQDEQWAYMAAREFLVDGQWRRFGDLDKFRGLGSPLLMYVEYPNGEHRVPMDTEIQVRARS